MDQLNLSTLIRMARLREMGLLDDEDVERMMEQLDSTYAKRLAKSLLSEKPTKSVRSDYHMIRQFAGVEDGRNES